MATTRKILGQLYPAAFNLETLYTVPADTQAVISSLMVCNTSLTDTFVIAVVPSGDTYGNEHNIYYGVELSSSNTFTATIGITLSAGDSIQVLSLLGNMAFSAFGQEIT